MCAPGLSTLPFTKWAVEAGASTAHLTKKAAGDGVSENHQLLGGQRNVLAAGLRENHNVLNADAQLPRQINARLRADDCPGGQGLRVGGGGVGAFVNLYADAVAKAVAEKCAVAGVFDDRPGGAVHRRAADAGPAAAMPASWA